MSTARFWTWDPWALRSAMRSAGVAVSDLEVSTGISRWALYKYAALQKTQGRTPSAQVASRIAHALGVEVASLYQANTSEAA